MKPLWKPLERHQLKVQNYKRRDQWREWISSHSFGWLTILDVVVWLRYTTTQSTLQFNLKMTLSCPTDMGHEVSRLRFLHLFLNTGTSVEYCIRTRIWQWAWSQFIVSTGHLWRRFRVFGTLLNPWVVSQRANFGANLWTMITLVVDIVIYYFFKERQRLFSAHSLVHVLKSLFHQACIHLIIRRR